MARPAPLSIALRPKMNRGIVASRSLVWIRFVRGAGNGTGPVPAFPDGYHNDFSRTFSPC